MSGSKSTGPVWPGYLAAYYGRHALIELGGKRYRAEYGISAGPAFRVEPGECEICLDDAPAGRDRCAACARWERYWSGLSAEAKQRELRWMAAHVAESDRT